MAQFTAHNTEGFSAAQLVTMNAAFEMLIGSPDDANYEQRAKHIADQISDAVSLQPGILVSAHKIIAMVDRWQRIEGMRG